MLSDVTYELRVAVHESRLVDGRRNAEQAFRIV